jgi:hypothetical protein
MLVEEVLILMEQGLLLKERKIFLLSFSVMVGVAIIARLLMNQQGSALFVLGLAVYGTLALKMLFIYMVYRFATALSIPLWGKVILCILAPFSILYLIPFTFLLYQAHNKIQP